MTIEVKFQEEFNKKNNWRWGVFEMEDIERKGFFS